MGDARGGKRNNKANKPAKEASGGLTKGTTTGITDEAANALTNEPSLGPTNGGSVNRRTSADAGGRTPASGRGHTAEPVRGGRASPAFPNPTTRKQIMTILRKHGPLNAHDIAGHLGITDIAVRRHLNHLERDKFVRMEPLRQAVGRPTFLYALTEYAENLFPKSYADISLEMLNDVSELQGPEIIDALFERRERRLEQKYKERLRAEMPLESLVSELAAIQEERGYMAEWIKDEQHSRYLLTEHNCPIHAIAHSYNQACSSELSLFRKVLGAEVEQLECKAKGGQRCVYEVKKDDESGK